MADALFQPLGTESGETAGSMLAWQVSGRGGKKGSGGKRGKKGGATFQKTGGAGGETSKKRGSGRPGRDAPEIYQLAKEVQDASYPMPFWCRNSDVVKAGPGGQAYDPVSTHATRIFDVKSYFWTKRSESACMKYLLRLQCRYQMTR